MEVNNLKITILFAVLAISILANSGFAMAQEDSASDTSTRFLIKSNNDVLKAVYGVHHNFDNGFTTELSPGQVKLLQKLDVETEEVQISYILVKPVCGDGICHPSESLKCPQDCREPDPEPDPEPCTPSVQYPYGIVMVNGGSGGSGVTVAVLDSGVYTSHPDLDVEVCKDATLTGITDGCADAHGHGTHVVGTIAANGGDGLGIFGVAPDATLMVIKVCGADGHCMNDDVAAGIRYAADEEADIISMSLGSDFPDSGISSAIDYAVSKGVLVVAAAGNDGPREGSIDYSAAYANVIAVGAIDIDKNIPRWSSRGIDDSDDTTISEKEVELGAPGVYVESTWNDGCYNTISGTSMATPHVAGLAAKLWQGNAADTRIYLQNLTKSHDLHTLGYDTATGYGLPIAPTV